MRVLNIHGPNDVRLDPTEPPQPGSKDAVIRVKACGICGSDLSYIEMGGLPPGKTTPIGHEAAGEVVAVGADVAGLAVGARVAINPMNTPSFIGNGRLVVTAAYLQPTEINVSGLLINEMSITASMGYPTEMPEVVAALPRLQEKAAGLISHRLPFDRVLEALDIAADRRSGKVMIDF